MSRVLIIAEAGVNHNGDFKIAKKMVEKAKTCGADIVKFQTFNPKKLASKHAPMAKYPKENLGVDELQEKMLSKLTLKQDEYAELSDYCKKNWYRFSFDSL